MTDDTNNVEPAKSHEDAREPNVLWVIVAGSSGAVTLADRTGHRSSQMINRYRRQARAAHKLGLGWLLPLDRAIEELSQRQPTREQWQPLAPPPVATKSEEGDQVADRPAIAPEISVPGRN